MSETRRRNLKLFSFLAERCSDAELRTLAECVQDELDFREGRWQRSVPPPHEAVEERSLRAPHRNHSAERQPKRREHPAPRTESGTRSKTGTTD